ncbi:MAG: LPS assembly protein LptD [Pseudomonadota bacterium]|nr:LPS assembly protein LptD [Pseudomonadota bacterium]MEC8820152.1 LPS assembly protein LptD [Pseudomonadota bacterium]
MPSTASPIIRSVLLFLLYWPVTSVAQTAADTDCRALKLPEHETVDTPGVQCSGSYFDANSSSTETTPTDSSISISADDASLVLDNSASIQGNVEIHTASRLIGADAADINLVDNQLNLQGHVIIREPGLLIRGESAIGDFFNGTGQVNTASFLLQESGFRGSAESLEKQSPTKIAIANGNFTQCAPGDDLWLMQMSTLNLDMASGTATAKDVTLRIKDVPVFYLPYAKFPIDTKRHSGILPPSLNKDSENGLNLTAAYYFNIATNLDASYTFSNIAQRGTLHQIESRYLTNATNNELQIGYISHDKFLVQQQNNTSQAASSDGQRWLISSQHAGQWQSLATNINYTALSDQDYLRDHNSSLVNGADHLSQTIFANDPYPRAKTALNQSASIGWHGDHFSANLAMEGFQSLLPEFDNQYERQPELNLAYRTSTGKLRFYSEAQLSEFSSKSEPGFDDPQSQRKLLTSGVIWPLSTSWGYAKSEIQVHHRTYRNDFGAGTEPQTRSHLTPTASLDSGLNFERHVRFNQSDWLQTLEPRLFILHQGGSTPGKINLFDTGQLNPSFNNLFRKNRFSGIDALLPGEQVSVALTSRLLRQVDGSEAFRIQAGQAFYHYDLPLQFNSSITSMEQTSLFVEASWHPRPSMKLDGKIQWDTELHRMVSSYAGFSFRSPQAYLINLFHIVERAPVSYLELTRLENKRLSHASIAVPLSPHWRIVGLWNYDWNRQESIESVAAVEYNGCCWNAKLAYREFIDTFRGTENSQQAYRALRKRSGIFIEFQLKGLGNIGSDLAKLLGRTVPGFSDQY